jgi:hypothetical protein
MRISVVITAAVAIAMAVALTGCAQSQEKIAEECAAKVSKMDDPPRRAQSDPRPEECEDLDDDDYAVIVVHRAYRDKTVFDKDGNVDPQKVEGAGN